MDEVITLTELLTKQRSHFEFVYFTIRKFCLNSY